MILMISGEGAGDMGVCRGTVGDECAGADFRPGPMAWLIDKLVAPEWGFSPMESGSVVFVSEGCLTRYCKDEVRTMALPGKGKPRETRFFYKTAMGLGRMAKAKALVAECRVGAVLFRDTDGTRSKPVGEWRDKVESMERGFAAEGFDFGVAMMPRPKSEAWLLCALKAQPYQHCALLEEESGNDASLDSLKKQVGEALAAVDKMPGDLSDLVADGTIDASRIDMPSYNRFRDRMRDVAARMLRNS